MWRGRVPRLAIPLGRPGFELGTQNAAVVACGYAGELERAADRAVPVAARSLWRTNPRGARAMASKHISADSPQAGNYGQEVTDRERGDLRRFRQGDGEIMIPPGEVVLLDYVCAACGRAYEIALQASSQPTLIDCNEERLCDGCQKKGLVTMLVERGTTVPEEKLLTMTVEELFTLASAKVR